MAGPGEPGETGDRILSTWREARAWWELEPYVEVSARIGPDGVRRLDERTSPSLGHLSDTPRPAPEVDRREDWSVRQALNREARTANLPKAYHQRLAETAPPQTDASWPVAVRSEKDHDQAAADVDRWGRPLRRASSLPIAYAPLHLMSGYAFGRSTMLAEELASFAAAGGCPAAAIADPFSLVGALEFAKACRLVGIKPLVGASVELAEGGEIVLIAKSERGYRSLSHLLTECHLGEPRGFPLATWERLSRHATELLCLTGGDVGPLDRLLVRRDLDGAMRLVERLISLYGRDDVFLEVERGYLPWSMAVERRLVELAEATGTTAVAGGMVTHARQEHYPAQDALLCAESLCLLDDVIGRKPRRHPSQPQAPRYPERSLNAERFLRTSEEMAAHFASRPELLEATLRIAERCDDDVLPGRKPLPSLFPDDAHALREIVDAEAIAVYGSDLSDRHRARLAHEVERIQRMGFSSHFLIAWDVCRWAAEQGVGQSGRGSVVDSAVAHVLGFSQIDAVRHDLHFDRFLPEDGSKRPDIDIDFESQRRDDIRGYMVRRYGVERVAGLAAIGTYRARGIVRDVGKAFGLPEETLGFLAKRIHGGVSADQLEAALQKRPELRGSKVKKETYRWIFALAERLMDVPTGTGLHSAGVIVSDSPLRDTVPVIWSASRPSAESGVEDDRFRMIQWDKRSAKHCFDKFDILCLRGQDVVGGVESRLQATDLDYSSHRVGATDDPEVYRTMRSGELIGVPQSASPAMRQAHQRLRTDDLHDASMVQAGIRPGVGGSVKLNELIARRRGKPYSFESPEFERILGPTYGIIVFQEQVDQLLQTFCGYTSGQAEDIRDAMYKRRREGFAETVREQVTSRAIANGHSPAVAERVYEYVSQFQGYGFAQGHALAFAELSLRCVHLMTNHPAEYFASLLSAQPAGYYGPCTIANEARSRGVRMSPPCVNRSRERFEVEEAVGEGGMLVPSGGIRVALTQVSGLSSGTIERILRAQDAALGDHSARAREPLSSGPSEGRVAVATAGLGDPEGRALWRSAGLRAFGSVFDFAAKVRPSSDELEALILCGALDALCPNRRAMLWAAKAALTFGKATESKGANPMLPLDFEEPTLDLSVEDFSEHERAAHERTVLGLDVERHLMAHERERALAKGCVTTAEARRLPPGTKAIVVGNPIRLRFPPTPSGHRVVFWDLEDETGLLNCTAFNDVYQRDGHAIVMSPYATVAGVVQDRDGHSAFLVKRVYPYSPLLLRGKARAPVGAADFLAH